MKHTQEIYEKLFYFLLKFLNYIALIAQCSAYSKIYIHICHAVALLGSADADQTGTVRSHSWAKLLKPAVN